MIRCTVTSIDSDGALVLDFGKDAKGRDTIGRLTLPHDWMPALFADADLLLVWEESGVVVYSGSMAVPRTCLVLPEDVIEAVQAKRFFA